MQKELKWFAEADYLRESCTASFDDDDVLTWYYLIHGPHDTPYEGGVYFGRLIFPASYPMSPPKVIMDTPSGRFRPGAEICMNISSYHPETWSSAYGVRTVLVSLISFMDDQDRSAQYAAGTVSGTPAVRKEYADKSLAWCQANDVCTRLFPEQLIAEANLRAEKSKKRALAAPDGPAPKKRAKKVAK